MNPAVQRKTDSDLIEQLWELYSDQDFQSMINYATSSAELESDAMELINLARLELGKPVHSLSSRGIFADLMAAMQHYHDRSYEKAAMDLSRWFLHKGYYSELALDRFCFACDQSNRFDLLYTVCSRLMKSRHSQPTVLGGFLLGAHESGRHDQVIQGFESFGKKINKTYVLHRVALSYIHLNRSQEAEKMLLGLYQAIAGKPYMQDLSEYKKTYSQKLPSLLKKEKAGTLESSEKMDLGMAHLFNGQYDQAIQVFEGIMKRL